MLARRQTCDQAIHRLGAIGFVPGTDPIRVVIARSRFNGRAEPALGWTLEMSLEEFRCDFHTTKLPLDCDPSEPLYLESRAMPATRVTPLPAGQG